LDIGSGLGGPGIVLASDYGAEVIGIDIEPGLVRRARRLVERRNLSGPSWLSPAHFRSRMRASMSSTPAGPSPRLPTREACSKSASEYCGPAECCWYTTG